MLNKLRLDKKIRILYITEASLFPGSNGSKTIFAKKKSGTVEPETGDSLDRLIRKPTEKNILRKKDFKHLMTNLAKQIKLKHLLLNVKRTTLSSCWNEFKWKNIMVT